MEVRISNALLWSGGRQTGRKEGLALGRNRIYVWVDKLGQNCEGRFKSGSKMGCDLFRSQPIIYS